MKKEIFAAAVLLLLAAASAWNLLYAKKLTRELGEAVDNSLRLAQSDQWEKATELAEAASRKWNRADNYTHIFITHSQVDVTTDSFGDYLSELYRKDAGGALGAHQKLIEHIRNIYDMERITLKSIF